MAAKSEYQGISPLLTCSADVLDLVLKSLSRADYVCLCLVNRSLRSFTETYLYANVQWIWVPERPPKSMVCFARSLLRRPQLGRLVRSLALMGASPGRNRVDNALPTSLLKDEDLSTSFLKELLNCRATSDQKWIDLLHADSLDALVALLIAHLPNLTTLHLGPSFTSDNACLGLLLRSALCHPLHYGLPKFEHLRTVTFNMGRISEAESLVRLENTSHALLLFYLPYLERIHTSLISSDQFTWPAPGGQAPVSLSLKELKLACRFRAAHLRNVLAVAPNLQSLRWDWDHKGITFPHADVQVIDLDQIAAALSLVQDTLTELIITARCTWGANKVSPRPRSKGSLQLLAGFPSLKSLQLPIGFLMGWPHGDPLWGLSDVLPRTIESLTIMDELWYHHHTNGWNEEAVLDVIKAWLANSERLPRNLRHFSLTLLYRWAETDELQALGARAGITVEINRLRRKGSTRWLPDAI